MISVSAKFSGPFVSIKSDSDVNEMITAISIARITATGIAMQNAMSFLLTVL